MPDGAITTSAATTGALLSDWATDPRQGGPLAGHDFAQVEAFAGAGKTLHLLAAALAAVAAGLRVVIVAFTNEQVRAIAARLSPASVPITHLAGRGSELDPPPAGVTSTNDVRGCQGARIVVATTWQAAHALKEYPAQIGRFDLGIVDEAYQVRSDNTALWCLGLAERWAMVGDPGQIEVFTILGRSPYEGGADPVTSIVDSARAQGSDFGILNFDWTWRLAPHTAQILEPFYGRPARPASLTADRNMVLGRAVTSRDRIVRAAAKVNGLAGAGGWGFLELPGEAVEVADPATAQAIAAIARDLVGRGATITCERDGARQLTPADIAVCVSTDTQRGAVETALSISGLAGVNVRTYNKHQGLEYAVSLLWHPVSGIDEVNGFYLDRGRLCVGVSRHRHAAIVVGRSGLRRILDDPPISEEAPWPGRPDRLLAGWAAHASLLEHLDGSGATVTV
jgi:hypothetical protein